MARTNPYTRLKRKFIEWSSQVYFPTRKVMFTFKDAKKASGSWSLYDVYQRIQAADTLGYDVHVRTSGDDIVMQYVKRPDPLPYELR